MIHQDLFFEYAVTGQPVVLPEEVHLQLQPSQFANEITLLTCTPYGINTPAAGKGCAAGDSIYVKKGGKE